jgi:hypothetical protein
MPLKMFRSLSSLQFLEKRVEQNLELYRSGDFKSFLKDEKLLTVDESLSLDFLSDLICSNNASDDYENSILVWKNLKITPRLAREARLWCLLTHTHGLDYSRARYPLNNGDDKDVKSIRAHFLVNNELRGIDRDNALSRLWVSAFIADKVDDLDFETALKVLLFQTDFREQLIGHPTIMRSLRTLNEVMCCAKRILIDDGNTEFFKRKDHKGQYKTWFHLLDIEGGRLLLDALEKDALRALVEKLATEASA